MGLWWSGTCGKLFVRPGFLMSQDCIADLSGTLLMMWKMELFSASRWLTVGSACRHYVLAHATGYTCFFSFAKARGKISDYDFRPVEMMG
eukprot:307271-Amphidinium_carterae.1